MFRDQHPQIAISHKNLGSVYEELEKLEEAIDHYSKALSINKSIYGDDHPQTANSYTNLGSAYEGSGNLQKAIKFPRY